MVSALAGTGGLRVLTGAALALLIAAPDLMLAITVTWEFPSLRNIAIETALART